MILILLLFCTCVYSLPTTSQPIHLTRRASSYSVPLINDLDLHELGVYANLGTPPQQFLLLFDTGSPDTWVPSTSCTSATGCPSFLHRYQPNDSSTYLPSNNEFDVNYGIGHVQGTFFKDVMALPEVPGIVHTVAAVHQAVGPISQQKYADSSLDGILGFSYIASLYQERVIPNPVFSVSFDSIILGDTHPTQTPVFVNTIENRWTIHVQGFEYEGANVTKNFQFNVLNPYGVDTGSNYMYLPTSLAWDLAKVISENTARNDNGLLRADCKYMKQKSTVKIHLTENKFLSLSVDKLMAKRESDGACLFLFLPSNDKMIIGNMFLKNFITIFEFGKIPRIGFSPVK